MEIFGMYIYGADAEQFCKLSKEEKKEWILKYTEQSNEVIIDEFLSNPINKNDCGCGCGGKKEKDANISKTISNEVAVSDENIGTSRNGKRGTDKGRKNSKKS